MSLRHLLFGFGIFIFLGIFSNSTVAKRGIAAPTCDIGVGQVSNQDPSIRHISKNYVIAFTAGCPTSFAQEHRPRVWQRKARSNSIWEKTNPSLWSQEYQVLQQVPGAATSAEIYGFGETDNQVLMLTNPFYQIYESSTYLGAGGPLGTPLDDSDGKTAQFAYGKISCGNSKVASCSVYTNLSFPPGYVMRQPNYPASLVPGIRNCFMSALDRGEASSKPTEEALHHSQLPSAGVQVVSNGFLQYIGAPNGSRMGAYQGVAYRPACAEPSSDKNGAALKQAFFIPGKVVAVWKAKSLGFPISEVNAGKRGRRFQYFEKGYVSYVAGSEEPAVVHLAGINTPKPGLKENGKIDTAIANCYIENGAEKLGSPEGFARPISSSNPSLGYFQKYSTENYCVHHTNAEEAYLTSVDPVAVVPIPPAPNDPDPAPPARVVDPVEFPTSSIRCEGANSKQSFQGANGVGYKIVGGKKVYYDSTATRIYPTHIQDLDIASPRYIPGSAKSPFPLGVWAPDINDIEKKIVGRKLNFIWYNEKSGGSPSAEGFRQKAKSYGLKIFRMPSSFMNPKWAGGLEDASDSTLAGWATTDEPEGHNMDPGELKTQACQMQKILPTKPIICNFQGANLTWGPDGRPEDVPADIREKWKNYTDACDILSHDWYPFTNFRQNTPSQWVHRPMDFVGIPVERLSLWSSGKPTMAFIESSNQNINQHSRSPTPAELRGEMLTAVIYGARGLAHFPQIPPRDRRKDIGGDYGKRAGVRQCQAEDHCTSNDAVFKEVETEMIHMNRVLLGEIPILKQNFGKLMMQEGVRIWNSKLPTGFRAAIRYLNQKPYALILNQQNKTATYPKTYGWENFYKVKAPVFKFGAYEAYLCDSSTCQSLGGDLRVLNYGP